MYIKKKEDRYILSSYFDTSGVKNHPSVVIQIASILAVLGEFELADHVYKLEWKILGPGYDKKANGILQRFIKPWPRVYSDPMSSIGRPR